MYFYLLKETLEELHMNEFCFGGIYNGRLWEKVLCVSALKVLVRTVVFTAEIITMRLNPINPV